MNSSLITSSFDFENWAYGLIGALIQGFANSVYGSLAVMVVAPDRFNLATPGPLLKVAFAIGLFGGLMGFFGVLKNTPLPPRIVETKTVTEEKSFGTGDGTSFSSTTEVKTTEVKDAPSKEK